MVIGANHSETNTDFVICLCSANLLRSRGSSFALHMGIWRRYSENAGYAKERGQDRSMMTRELA